MWCVHHRLSSKEIPETERNLIRLYGYVVTTFHPCFQDKIDNFLKSLCLEVDFAVWNQMTS